MDYQTDLTHKINWGNVSQRSFEMGPIRPPSEGKDNSLLIRATRNCPWNRCLFCSIYKDHKFEYRSVAEIKQDIDVARVLHDEIKAASWKFDLAGKVSNELIRAIVQGNPEIYLDNGDLPLQNLANVANWIASGARTVFLQDADTLIMRTPELVQVIKYLKETFPTIERITSYARAKSCFKKTLPELKDLHRAGLSRLHIGLETGNDQALDFMHKGVNQEQHIIGGKKVVAAGISLSEYVMPGLGGKRWSEVHALDSARALSAINPDFIRLRSLIVRRNSLLYDKYQQGEFEPLSEDELVDEIALFIENLNCNSYVISDQMSNLLFEVEGQFPKDKERILRDINQYRQKQPLEKLKFRLNRRLRSHLAVHGGISQELNQKVSEALESIANEAPEAESKTNQAILALKEGFV